MVLRLRLSFFSGRFYNMLANYLCDQQHFTRAIEICQASISLAISTGNTKRHSDAMYNLAWINWRLGDYSSAQLHAYEAQRLAKISANLYREARALLTAAVSWIQLGNYKQNDALCHKASRLLVLCGMANSMLAREIMASQAEIHMLKSEYNEAYNIHIQMLQEVPVDQDVYAHAGGLLNIAQIGVSTSMEKNRVLMHIEKAREIFQTANLVTTITMCDIVLADLYLREGDIVTAKRLFEKYLKFEHIEIKSYCLERLADVGQWRVVSGMFGWTTIFLVHALKFKERLGINKALKFMGDIFLAQNDEATALNLFTVALEGFTLMDVHRSRAECMLQLGDISKGRGNMLKAVELWETARPLFEKSSQAKQVENIDERLASVGEDVLEQHRKNMARLVENVPTGIVEDVEDDLSDIEDHQEDSSAGKLPELVAI
jgi:tetratricopeptide (TPR) repeat protein